MGVSISATEKDIKNAYRKKARDLHPDKNPSPEGKDSNFDTSVFSMSTFWQTFANYKLRVF